MTDMSIESHPMVGRSEDELAAMESDASQLYEHERYNEAENLYRQICDIRKERSGPEAALRDKHNLSATLVKQQKFQEAEPILRRLHGYLNQRTSGRESETFIEQEAACLSLLRQALEG